ncbi:TIGR04388 family protein [Leptospira sp. 201903071]|uniref:TIGR04388 family protein n=1 Tax=Leptospira ainazelensis TaxID=2810034 RepID=UPI001966502C|nr:TIGR04388 family protein [Leptospira ainazelensis]MBM9502903.1 TIGR04388 family protein [Leptospira ainazelensis]
MSGTKKRSSFRFLIILFGIIIFFSHEKSRLFAQPVGPIDLNTTAYQANDWDSLFEQVFHLSNVASWDQNVNQQFTTFRADWETQANLEFSNILSSITQTDGVLGNQAYIDYVTNYLKIEKEDAAKDWEVLASTRIQQERTYFLTSLQNSQVDALGNSIPNQTRAEISQALAEWNANAQQNVQVGLYEFQKTLTDLQSTFQTMWNSISATDAEFAANLQQIEAFEAQVRDTIKGNNDGLKAYLLQQSLLHNRDATGVSQLGDFSALTSAQLLTAFNSIDETKLNTAGRRLKDLIDDLSTALDPANPASLTDIADTMQDYLQEQLTYANTTALGYRAAEYNNWSYADPDSSVHNYNITNTFSDMVNPGNGWTNSIAIAARNYIDSPSTANKNALMSQLGTLLGNPSLVVSDVSNVDLVATSTAAHLSGIDEWNSDIGNPFLRLGGTYRNDGASFWTLEGLYWAVWGPVAVPYTITFAENHVYFQGNIQVHDLNAQNNAVLYEGYKDELNGKFNTWQGTLLPAIQNWEQQVTDYKARYTEWQTKKLDLQANLQTQYQSQSAELFKNRDEWLIQVSNLQADANAIANNTSVPTFSSNVNTSSLQSISDQISSFHNTNLPDSNIINQFSTNIKQTINGAYNLSLIEANQISALESQKEALEGLAKNLEKQREMNDNVSEDVYIKFTGLNFKGDKSNAEGAGMCSGDNFKANRSACETLQGDDKNFHNKYKDVYTDASGNIHVVQEVKTGAAILQAGKDAAEYDSYHHETSIEDRVIGNAGTVKLADTSKLGGIFNSNWLSEENDDALVAYMNQSYTNRTQDYLNDAFIDSISKNIQSIDTAVAVNNKDAQQSAVAQSSTAKLAVSLVQTMFMGGSGTAWAKQQVHDMTVSAVSKAISKAFPNLPPDLIAAFIGSKENEKAQRKAQQEMQTRTIVTAGVIGAGLTVLGPLALMGGAGTMSLGAVATFAGAGVFSGVVTASALTYVPGLKEIGKPLATILNKGTSELLVGTTKLLTSSDFAYGMAGLGLVSKDTLKHYNTEGMETAEYVRGKDLQADLAKADYQAQYKAAFKDQWYLEISKVVSKASGGEVDPKLLSKLWQDYDAKQTAKAAKREQEQQMLSTAASIAAAVAMQFLPGPGTVAGASMMTQIGNFFSSAQGFVTLANAAVQGAIASRHGNMNEVFAGVANGLLLAATGPGGLAGNISYTPPTKVSGLGGLIDQGMNGSAAFGWGGGFAFGSSALNGGIGFVPGSGISINVGGTIGNGGGFANISYNVESGHTSGSVGIGQEYGTNIGVSFSTDHSVPPGIFAGFGCDVKGDNCGGGRNALGAGGSINISGDGNVTFGADILGNQAASISYNVNTGSWSGVEVSTTWAQDFTYMNAQQVMDAKIKAQDAIRSGKEAGVLADPNIINKSEKLKGFASQMGLSPEQFSSAMSQLSSDLKNGKLSGKEQDAAMGLVNQGMNLIHGEAYPGKDKIGNAALQDAIHDSPAVYGTNNNSVDPSSPLSQFLGQATIYFNNLAGNAFGEFTYVDQNGHLVFQQCFVAGTLVHTKSGLVPIEEVRAGDMVLSYNEFGEELEYNRVLKTYVRQTETIFKLTYENGRVVETTASHPFQIEGKGWIEVKDLRVGDRSILSNESSLSISSIEISEREETVYNLKVEDAHTYFVTEDAILVHNANYNEQTGLFDTNRFTLEKADPAVLNKLFISSQESPSLFDKLMNKLGMKDIHQDNGILENKRKAAAEAMAQFPADHKFEYKDARGNTKYITKAEILKDDKLFSANNPKKYTETVRRAFDVFSARSINSLPESERGATRETLYNKLTDVVHTTQWGANNGLKLQMMGTIEYMRAKYGENGAGFTYDPTAHGAAGEKYFNEVKAFIFSGKDSSELANSFGSPVCRMYSNFVQGVMNGSFEGSFAEYAMTKFRQGDVSATDKPYPVHDAMGVPRPSSVSLVFDRGGINAGSSERSVTLPPPNIIDLNAPLTEGEIQNFIKSGVDKGDIKEGSVVQFYVDNDHTAGANHFLTGIIVKNIDGTYGVKISDHTDANVQGKDLSDYLNKLNKKIHKVYF